MTGPEPIGHGWIADIHSGKVEEVWAFGDRAGHWVLVASDGLIVQTGNGSFWSASLADSKAEAIRRVLVEADEELSRARAALDRLRAEFASA